MSGRLREERGRHETLGGAPDRRLPGLWRARVRDNDDPEQRGRVLVDVPEVVGEGQPHPEWADAVAGMFFEVPEVGAVVWCAFVSGSPDWPVWLPGWWIQDAVVELLKTNYPKRRGLVTPSGHALVLDDSDGSDGDVFLRQRDGAQLKLAGDGTAALDAKTGHKVKLQGGGPAAARVGDKVAADTSMAAWMTAAQLVLAAAATLTSTTPPVAPTDFGKIAEGSLNTEIG